MMAGNGRRTPTVSLILFVAMIMSAFQVPGFLLSLRPSDGTVMDFYKEWNSARNWWGGIPVYTSQRETFERDFGFKPSEFPFPEEFNTHPPTSTLLVLPFGRMEYPDAQLCWNLLSLMIFGLCLRGVSRELGLSVSVIAWGGLLVLLTVCDPFRQTIHQGQVSFVLLGCAVGTWLAERRGKSVFAGFFIALAASLKLFPAFWIIYAICQKQWKTVGYTALWGLVLVIVTGSVLSFESFQDYLAGPIHGLRPYLNEWGNNSLFAFWERIFGTPTYRVEPLIDSPWLKSLGITLSIGLLLAAIVFLGVRARTQAQKDLVFSMAIVSSLILSPIAWGHYFILLALPLFVVGRQVFRGKLAEAHATIERSLAVPFVIFVVLLWLSPRLVWRPTLEAPLKTPTQSIDRPAPPRHAKGYQGRFATPTQSLTVLSYQFYALLGLILLHCLLYSNAERIRSNATENGSHENGRDD